jgi:transcriptional regulator with XRE-family HTH domain
MLNVDIPVNLTDEEFAALPDRVRESVRVTREKRQAAAARNRDYRTRRRQQREAMQRAVTQSETPNDNAVVDEPASVDSLPPVWLREVRDYPTLVEALKARRQALGLTQAEVDDLAGLQDGYTGKIEQPRQNFGRIMGDLSFRLLLATYGVKLIVAEIKPGAKPLNNSVGERRRGPPATRSKRRRRGKRKVS